MAKGYVIFNPLAGNGQAQEDAQLLQFVLDEELYYYDDKTDTEHLLWKKGE